ncbi:DEAD/DEAH box helicase family protein [Streptomyces sp. PRKS01-65]|nr:type ISP restriction/modification enzyme [Streptomyces harenosi]NEY33197.1 DEAD/DEAH box helicase family protein [Streptomyces harenosi]
MVEYLRKDPQWSEQFSQVWMYGDWPGAADDRRDVGIDLVAQDRVTGGYWAIQCKFHEPDHRVEKSDIDSFFTASGKGVFTRRLIISTAHHWSHHAEQALDDQQIPVQRIGLPDIEASPIEWHLPPTGTDGVRLERAPRKQLRPHQQEAVDAVFRGFGEGRDRGKLIMACGTGKTFTSLKIAERLHEERRAAGRGERTTVLFLVPSIALLSQSLREWTAQAAVELHPFAVCSDAKVGKSAGNGAKDRSDDDNQDMAVHDLSLPATTDPDRLVAQLERAGDREGLTVVFSTYQSIGTVSEAQKRGLGRFDLVLCDEAHRTTGAKLADQDESAFMRVHDDAFLGADRRLYMTATPRVYGEDAKTEAELGAITLASMDNEAIFGPEFHRLGFGQAVEQGLLTDYKVLVLTVEESAAAAALQQALATSDHELSISDAAKIIGCWNALAKRTGSFADGTDFGGDEAPMRRAVAFSRSIADSKAVTDHFASLVDAYEGTDEDVLYCEVGHVDGGMNMLERNRLLDWLKEDPGQGRARILSNARCLSEGVDVPSLDAVLFLNPRNSTVDVVQSVGRVMRTAPGKKYGYIILPVAVPAGSTPEQALADNRRFKTVWQVLNALRAHDERLNAIINQIDVNKARPDKLAFAHIGAADFESSEGGEDRHESETRAAQRATQLMFAVDDWRDAIFARLVKRVGQRRYWEDWARDIADIADRHVTAITTALGDPGRRAAFEEFLAELRCTINPGVTDSDAIDMLAQHIVTKPVFDALFKEYGFLERNPVSAAMQKMLGELEGQGLEAESKTLQGFYDSVRQRAEGLDSEGRQKVIVELYDKFFRTALPKTSDQLGIVYTPVEVVDFILRAADQALTDHFGTSLSTPGIHVIDPFTGTGTFPVRLLQSGLIKPEDLDRKYAEELHANEIILLAYYLAAVNIEAAYHALAGRSAEDGYRPFDGIVLTDTFQLAESGDGQLDGMDVLQANSDRARKQLDLPIKVIVGNPPYSVGQDSVNDNNQNMKYPALDRRIAGTYVARSAVGNKNKLYDSYIRAIRWASDRLGDEGVIAYVSNGGYVDGTSADGLRKCLVEEFDAVYCYNLRGNQRTAGEQARREGGKIFGSGSRNTVAILVLVKGGRAEAPKGLHYRDIGDYKTREEKLALLGAQDLRTVEWQLLTPDANGDWINQRDKSYQTFRAIGDKDKVGREQAVFREYSSGLNSARDAWVYNFSAEKVRTNMESMIGFYNRQVLGFQKHCQEKNIVAPTAKDAEAWIDTDATRISWNRADKTRLAKGETYRYATERVVVSSYRPFTKQWLYFDSKLNDMTYQLPRMFPGEGAENFGFYITGPGADEPFSVLLFTDIPNLHAVGTRSMGPLFSRYTYQQLETEGGFFIDDREAKIQRLDNVTDAALKAYQAEYGTDVTKDDIFYYTYALLHSRQYRELYAADLKKALPRIPMVRDFHGFAAAGRELAELHIGYENVAPHPGVAEEFKGDVSGVPADELFRVTKMRFGKTGKETDRTRIVYNSRLTLTNIPEEAYRYQLGARSAIEWIIDRYQVKKDKQSHITNDPNDWSDDPRYIVDLLKRIVTVSLETMRIVDGLPPLELIEG